MHQLYKVLRMRRDCIQNWIRRTIKKELNTRSRPV